MTYRSIGLIKFSSGFWDLFNECNIVHQPKFISVEKFYAENFAWLDVAGLPASRTLTSF
jgi:hypothetical protein